MRMLHVMIRVTELDRSISFYTDTLKMKVLRKVDFPEGKFTLAFLGYDDESQTTVLELTHNWEQDTYDLGNAFGHIAIGVDDIYHTCEVIKKNGGKVTREPGPMKHGTTVLAFIEDPDGYKIELLQDR
ncbi:lactoylglutathione lyase [Candidatus Omnitrophota bacterium]